LNEPRTYHKSGPRYLAKAQSFNLRQPAINCGCATNQMLTTILAYVFILLYFVAIEGRMRQGEEAKSLQRGKHDLGSTHLLSLAIPITCLVLLFAPVLNHLQLGRVTSGSRLGWIGIIMMLGGLTLRAWAHKTLGAFYTRTLRVIENQHIVVQGPYRIIRHPGYLGMILMFVGAGVATLNWMATAIAAVVLLAAYIYRIRSEEAMLITELGHQYKVYKARTSRLIPFVY
jgi:protein-S-isoprenylcysteine O-methyltransferase Ste14